MKALRWLRPGGLIGLAVFLLLVFGVWYLLSGWLLKTTIQTIGTRIVGAKVEVASANLTVAPLGFNVHDLRVADPARPMQNMVEIGAAAGTVEPWKLLLGHVIVDDMSIDQVRFNTPRSTSGALRPQAPPVRQTQKEGPAANPLAALKPKLPSAEEILKRSNLVTPQRIQELQQAQKTQRAQVEQAIKALPDQQRLEAFKRQVQQLTQGKVESLGDLEQRRRQLDQLKQEIRQDKTAVENARRQIQTAKDTLTAKFEALQKAPQEDINRIEQQYGLNAMGASNLTRLLFGDQAQKWFDLIRTWYGRIARFMPSGSAAPQPAAPARGTGHFVHFHELHPLPSFLLVHAAATAVAPIGTIGATLRDVTPQPQILGRPTTVQASGKDLHNVKAVQLSGVFDHVHPEHVSDRVKWHIDDWAMTDARIVKSDAVTATLAKALAMVDGSADLVNGRLDAAMKAAFHGAKWTTSAGQDWASRLIAALQNITSFDVTGRMQGSLEAPSLSLSSNLDQKIGSAVVAQLKTETSALQQRLQSRLGAQVEQAAGPYREEVKLITQSQGTADSRLNALNDLLQAKLQSQLKSQENKAKKKLEDQLKKKLGF